jgi:hypothetical protein
MTHPKIPSSYEPIWEAVKTHGYCIVSVNPQSLNTLIKAVAKRKYKDKKFLQKTLTERNETTELQVHKNSDKGIVEFRLVYLPVPRALQLTDI